MHTPGPWENRLGKDGHEVWAPYGDTGSVRVAACGWADSFDKINARRIVACVNACAGMSIEDVERWAARGGFSNLPGLAATCNQAAGMLAAQQQRDELSEALAMVRHMALMDQCSFDEIAAFADAAIAKVKGGS